MTMQNDEFIWLKYMQLDGQSQSRMYLIITLLYRGASRLIYGIHLKQKLTTISKNKTKKF